jgi:predicted MFS family arabinose efflux permease
LTTSYGRLKAGYYTLTASGALATSYYFNYLFFFLRDRFGFDNRSNLAVAAVHGAIYVVASWQCGRFAERHGLHTSLKVGFATLVVCLLAGAAAPWVWLHLVVVAVYTVAICFIWPAIEALITHDEPAAHVPHAVGLYNCTWSSAAAVAYFTGGALYDRLGIGALFLIPAAVFAAGFVATRRLERRAAALEALRTQPPPDVLPHPEPRAYTQPVPPATFLRLAWIANPFAYVAIYTLLATMPTIAERFALTPGEMGLLGSVWLFARLAAFVGLWRWTGWHYRFRWLGGGFAVLALSFVAILIGPALWIVVIAEMAFGVAAGLMYYSSLFYSMDVGEAKAEHGGLHEAAIGAGIFLGPFVGAASLQLFPGAAYASAVAVSGMLVVGLTLLVSTWARARQKTRP